MVDPKDKIIKDAQYRKGLSIAFFNSTNSAISLVTPLIKNGQDIENVKYLIVELRNLFLEQHKEYYATVIANVGVVFDSEKTIEKIKATKSLQELTDVWTSISAEERHNEAIRKVTAEHKLTLK